MLTAIDGLIIVLIAMSINPLTQSLIALNAFKSKYTKNTINSAEFKKLSIKIQNANISF